MTEPTLPDMRVTTADAQREDRPRVRYLPSAQVLAELSGLGPDLRRLAQDLRDRLSESDAQLRQSRWDRPGRVALTAAH